jgi:hypothetical protein
LWSSREREICARQQLVQPHHHCLGNLLEMLN